MEIDLKTPELQKSELNVVFMIGRLNPPTPGHMAAIETVLRISREKEGVARVFISSKQNDSTKIPKYNFLTKDKKDKPKKTRKKLITETTTKKIGMYVKDARAENPLSATQKKKFLIDMVMNRQFSPDWTAGEWSKDELEKVFVISDECKGLYKAFGCAHSVQKIDENHLDDPNKLTYVLGKEIDIIEAEMRGSNCVNDEEEPRFSKYNCLYLERTAEGTNPEAYSGSKIRLLAGCESPNIYEFIKAYEGYLTIEQSEELFNDMRQGLCIVDSDESKPKRNRTAKLGGKKPKYTKKIIKTKNNKKQKIIKNKK